MFYDPLADQPIGQRQHHIHGSDGCDPCFFDQADDAAQQFTVGICASLGARPSTLPGFCLRDFFTNYESIAKSAGAATIPGVLGHP